MATENAVMAATLTPGRTMISNAASEKLVETVGQRADDSPMEVLRNRDPVRFLYSSGRRLGATISRS